MKQQVDTALYQAISEIDVLNAVTPLNFREQKTLFFDSNFSINPEFVYAEQNIDLFQTKRALYNIAIDQLEDADLIQLYEDVIESYVDKLDQYKAIGTPEFLYDSLRYYGEPSLKDINNASFILHLPDEIEEDQPLFAADDIMTRLKAFAQHYNLPHQMVMDEQMIANIMVSGSTIKVNRAAKINHTELSALEHHEVGVHLVTTLNARAQPLKILSLGSPVNTTTQEGLAILCEYLSGNLTLPRLKVLALRVMAVQSLILEKDFKRTFLLLKEQYETPDDLAFTITARVYRGGGLTKDYLYLQGFHQMLNAYEQEADFNNLLVGKTSLEHLPLITRLINKGLLSSPNFISPAIAEPAEIDTVQKFIAHAIK